MSLVLEKQAFALPLTDPAAKLLLVAMCHLSAHGEMYANPSTLSRMTGLGESTIRRKKTILVKKNLLKKIPKSTSYFINLETLSPSEKTLSPSEKTLSPSGKTLDYAHPLYRNGTNGMNGETDVLPIPVLASQLNQMYHRKKQHPGNPDLPDAVDRDHPDREEFWKLCKLEKSMQAALDERMQQATQK